MKYSSLFIFFLSLTGLQKKIVPSQHLIPIWRMEGNKVCYEQCTAITTSTDAVVRQQCCFINKMDSIFIFQNKIISLAVDTSAYFDGITDYFDKQLPTVDFQIEHTFWLKAIITANGKIHHWGLYSSRNKTDKSYLIPLNKAILAMPRWKPAIKNGKKVNSLATFSVKFTIK
jgi:hypothetical protein